MSDELTKPLIVSAVGPLANKIKCSLQWARKNRKLAEQLAPVFNLVLEQVLPKHLINVVDNYQEVNAVHNLVFLLSLKAQQVFTSRIIHTAIDQNWDLKGLK